MQTWLDLGDRVKFLFTGRVYEPVNLVPLSRTKEITASFHIVGDHETGVVIRRYASRCHFGLLLRDGHWQHEERYGQHSDCSREEVVRGQWYTHACVSASLRDRGCTVQHRVDKDTQRILDIYQLRVGLLSTTIQNI